MRYVVGTGTDIATVCFFDPAALPSNFDAMVKSDLPNTLESLSRDCRIWTQTTGADGSYLFHFYVDTEIPEPIARHAHDAVELPRFAIPSGTVWACGAEFAGQNPEKGHGGSPKGSLSKYPHMGGCIQVPPGNYSVTAWRTEWPDEMIEEAVERRVGKLAVRREAIVGTITGILFFGLILASTAGVFMTLGQYMNGNALLDYWGILLGLWMLCVGLMRWLKRNENPAKAEAEAEFPSIVVRMIKLP